MQDIETLRDERKYKLRSAKELADRAANDKRLLSDEEQRTLADLKAEADKIQAQIAAIQKSDEATRMINAALEADATPNQRVTAPMKPLNGDQPGESRPKVEFTRYGKLKAFRGPNAEERAFASGQWFRASFGGDAVAKRWCANNGIETRAMTEGLNSAGGVLVPEQLSQTIVDLREDYGIFRSNCRIQPMSGDTITIPRKTGRLTAYFVGEGVAGTESQQTWDGVKLTAKKLMVITPFSSEFAEDAVIDIADNLAMDIALALATKEDECGFNGDGGSTYGGIQGIVPKFEAGTTLAGYKDAASGHDSISEIDIADITSLMGLLPRYAKRGAAWFCSPVVQEMVFTRLAATAGGNTIQTMQGTYQPAFLGYPIVTSDLLFDTTTATAGNNKVMLMFGNLGLAASLGDRRSLMLGLSDQKYWSEDMIAIKGTERIDINIHDIGDTSVAGPVVALIGQT